MRKTAEQDFDLFEGLRELEMELNVVVRLKGRKLINICTHDTIAQGLALSLREAQDC